MITKQWREETRELLTNAPERFEGVTTETTLLLLDELDRLETLARNFHDDMWEAKRALEKANEELRSSIRLYVKPQSTREPIVRHAFKAGELLPRHCLATWARDLKVP